VKPAAAPPEVRIAVPRAPTSPRTGNRPGDPKRHTRNWAKASHSSHEAAIVEHVSRHLARPAFVVHEIESELVHLDVHVVPPDQDRDFWFLFTTGMSARPMKKPSDAPGSSLAELSILLPRHWRLDRESWRETRWFWPVRELKAAALLPHRHGTGSDPATRSRRLMQPALAV
jgi:hypothetical protein